METAEKIKELLSLEKLITVSNFKRLLIFTLTTTWVFYLGSMNYSIFKYDNFENLLQNFIILRFIALYLIVRSIAYTLPTFLLRLLFHKYAKSKFIKIKLALQSEGRMSYLKSIHAIHGFLNFIFTDFVYKMGFLSKKELENEVEITEADKEEFLNEALCDCYKWICINIHFILTLIIVWQYLNYWILALLILLLLYMFILPLGIIFIAMNLDFFTRFRRKILNQKTIL